MVGEAAGDVGTVADADADDDAAAPADCDAEGFDFVAAADLGILVDDSGVGVGFVRDVVVVDEAAGDVGTVVDNDAATVDENDAVNETISVGAFLVVDAGFAVSDIGATDGVSVSAGIVDEFVFGIVFVVFAVGIGADVVVDVVALIAGVVGDVVVVVGSVCADADADADAEADARVAAVDVVGDVL